MGFYSLYRIIKDFLRKPFRTAFIFIIIVLIISFCSSCFASSNEDFDNAYMHDGFYDVDTAQLINNFQSGYLASVMNTFYRIKSGSNSQQKQFVNRAIELLTTNFYYCEMTLSKSFPNLYARIYIYNSTNMSNSYDIMTHFDYLNDFVSVPVAAMNIECRVIDISHNSIYVHADDYTFTKAVPFSLLGVRNSDFDTFIHNYNNKSSDDLYVMLQNINENIKKTNDFLTDSNIDNSNVNTPSQPSQNDPTSAGFDNIFNSFKSAFTDSSQSEMSITIPFANRSFYLTSDFLSRYLKDVKFIGNVGFLDFVHMFWLFVFSLYIVKDVEKVVEKIKNGDIATSSDTNIKTEML